MGNLKQFSDAGTPLLEELGVAAPSLTDATRTLTPFSEATTVALKSLGTAGEESGPVFAQAEPCANDLVTRLDTLCCRSFDCAGEVHAANHGELANDGPLACDGETVLVIKARVPDPDRHVFVGQVLGFKLLEPAGETVLLCGEYCSDRTVCAHCWRSLLVAAVACVLCPSWLMGTTCGSDCGVVV